MASFEFPMKGEKTNGIQSHSIRFGVTCPNCDLCYG